MNFLESIDQRRVMHSHYPVNILATSLLDLAVARKHRHQPRVAQILKRGTGLPPTTNNGKGSPFVALFLFSAAVTAEPAPREKPFDQPQQALKNLTDNAKNLGEKQTKLLKRSFGNAKQT